MILCDSGPCNWFTPTSHWSDVVVFGPGLFTSTATIYSNDDGSLAALLAGGFAPTLNSAFLVEDPSGVTYYDPFLIQGGQGGREWDVQYQIHSAGPSGVPEPGTVLALFGALAAICAAVKRRTV